MRHDALPTVSTEQLRRLLAGAGPVWLVFAPDRAAFADGHIPGSLTATDAQLLAALPSDVPVVLYGEDREAGRARALAAELATTRRDVRWYAGGLQAWSGAGLPLERLPGGGGSGGS